MNENINDKVSDCRLPEASVIRKLREDDTQFVGTVFNSNFIRIINPSHFNFSSIYAEKKKTNSLDTLTDYFWFQAKEECAESYHRLPMVYPFIHLVNQYIEANLEGIHLINRQHPFEKATGVSLTRRRTYLQFNEFIDFLCDVDVLKKKHDEDDVDKFSMEGYYRFKIIRN